MTTTRVVEVVTPGPQLTVQDLGRRQWAEWGIGQGGAADRGSLRLANRLVGNREDAAAFELLLGGAALRFHHAAVVALTGAVGPFTVDGRPGRGDGPQAVLPGATIRFGTPPTRLRSYLAVRGGLATVPVLGSRSTDERSGIGRALRTGEVVELGSEMSAFPDLDVAPTPPWPAAEVRLRATLGPRDAWFTDAAIERFAASTYVVDAASNRVGVRLSGPPLDRRTDAELLSEPTIRGAIEVPGDGLPIVFGADHPTTCGYPVVAVLDPEAADRAAQCRPGQPVRFTLSRPTVRIWPTPTTNGADQP